MRRWLNGGGRDWLWLFLAALGFLAALIFPFTSALALSSEEEVLLSACESGQLIRLHIVAHSDSPKDQAIKLAVRNAMINEFGKLLVSSAAEGFEKAYEALVNHVENMRTTAESCAKSLGFDGPVKAEAGILELPEKRYGQVILPKGEYHALRITLGNGAGQNWWCVLFPQLCLSLSSDETDKAVLHPHWGSERIFSNWLSAFPPP